MREMDPQSGESTQRTRSGYRPRLGESKARLTTDDLVSLLLAAATLINAIAFLVHG